MKNTFIALLVLVALTPLWIQHALAQSPAACKPVYGGGNTCVQGSGLTISKEVQDPQTGAYVTAYPIYTIFFNPGQIIPFKITATNTYDTALSNVEIQDQFPPYVSYVSGNGTFSTSSDTLTTTISNLPAHQSESIYVKGKVAAANLLPAGQSNICVANQVTATANNLASTANSQFCITNGLPAIASSSVQPTNPPSSPGGLPVYPPVTKSKTTPATGPNAMAIAALLPIGIAGILIRKKAKPQTTV